MERLKPSLPYLFQAGLIFIMGEYFSKENKLMKVAVIGSRTFTDYDLLKNTLQCVYISEIISGGDLGADKLAERYAEEKNIPIRIIPHTENPEKTSLDRTYSIITLAQLVIAFWDGKSQGTRDLINYARNKGKQLKIKNFKDTGSNEPC